MNLAKENEEKERSKGKEVKETHHHHHARASGDCLDRTLCGTGTKCWNIGITPHVLTAAAEQIGMSFAEVNDWLKYMNDVNWTFGSGAKISWRNFRRSLRMWHVVENHKRYRHKTSNGNQRGKIDQLREDGLKRQRQAAQIRRVSEAASPKHGNFAANVARCTTAGTTHDAAFAALDTERRRSCATVHARPKSARGSPR